VIGVALLLNYIFKPKLSTQPYKISYLNPHDIISIAIALFILGLLTMGPIRNSIATYGSVNIPVVAVNYMNTSIDDTNHYSRINDRLQYDRGVIYKSDAVELVALRDTVSSYPPGWHSANAMLIKSVSPDIQLGGESLLGYVLTKLFWMFVLVYCFCRATLNLFSFSSIRKDRKKYVHLAWLLGALSFFSYYVLVEQFREGFYSFIPLMVWLLL
jgi:hypothetical protein